MASPLKPVCVEGGPGRLTDIKGGFLPGPILLMGAPGVGKGTQARELMARWRIPQVSTGDLLRANVAAGTEEGRQAKQLMDSGQLVLDELVNRMVKTRLAEPDAKSGYILDGYPRTLAQAEWLDTILEQEARGLPVVAVSIQVEYDQLLRRVTGRRICPVDGSIYNVYLKPPARENICDLDGAILQRRDDDSEEVFRGRMRAYEKQTAPVVDHYRLLCRVMDVDGSGQPVDVSARLEQAVYQLRGSTK